MRSSPIRTFSGPQPHDANVERAAQSLYEDLQKVIQPDDDDQIEEWLRCLTCTSG
jgi:hypothetical protein